MKEVRHFDPEISYILSMFSDFGEIIEGSIQISVSWNNKKQKMIKDT